MRVALPVPGRNAKSTVVDAVTRTASGLVLPPTGENTPPAQKKRGVPEGLWIKCPGCSASLFRKEVERRLNVCLKCDYHFYVSAHERIAQVLDEGTFEPMDEHLRPMDPLGFADRKPYAQRLEAEQRRTGLTDAVITGTGMIRARRVAFAVTDSGV